MSTRLVAAVVVLAASVAPAARGAEEQDSSPSWKAVERWSAELPENVTSACFLMDSSGKPVYFACADKQLLMLNDQGQRLPELEGAKESPVERLERLPANFGSAVMLGYENWGKNVYFFDRAGRRVAKQEFADEMIYWLAVDRHRLSVISDGIRMYNVRTDGNETIKLAEQWSNKELGGWNVALGDFGGGFEAATSEGGGEILFFDATGKTQVSKDFGYATSLQAMPLPNNQAALIVINEPNAGDDEEVLAIRHDRILFRRRIGKAGEETPNWRWRRLVVGRFVEGETDQVAVLRGDGSVVVFDQAGTPLNMLAARRARTAIELGARERNRDTLLACETTQLRCFAFPERMPADVAEEMATVVNPNQKLLTVGPKDTADDLWARALWLSIPSNNASSDEVAMLFTAALARAKNKAPIYVSFGDADSGPNRIREMFDQLTASLQETAVTEIAAQVKDKFEKGEINAEDSKPEVLGQIVHESYQKAVRTKTVWTGIDDLSKLMREGSDSSLTYYVAATVEDPTYKVAWYRLAKRATGDLGVRAVEGFMRSDPDNALPYYIRAAAEAEAGDLGAALQCVRAGNAKPVCRWYEADVPMEFELHFPETEDFEGFGVNGKRITRLGLRYLLRRFEDAYSYADPLTGNLRSVARSLVDEGMRLRAEGNLTESLLYFESVRDMGACLMRVQPREGLLMVTGLGIIQTPKESLREVYELQNASEQLKSCDRYESAWESFREKFRAALAAMKPTEDDFRIVLTGEKDAIAEEQKLLESALQESGLLNVLDRQQKD